MTNDDRILALLAGDESRTHGERLPGEIARALDQAGIPRDRIDLLAVATGPGAFTGLRIGLAAMQGLAMTLNKPVAGVSALDALAEQALQPTAHGAERSEAGVAAERSEAGVAAERSEAEVIVPWMDAQRGDVFATVIDRRSGATLETPTAATPKALLESWRSHLANRRAIFIGDAAIRDGALIEQAGVGLWETRAPSPLAPQIAIIGRRRADNGEAGPPHALEPIYVRRPDAEIERDNRRRPKADPERNVASEGDDR